MRPELGAYGAIGTAGTPHLDAFAADALLFERAYVQQAVCGPSRNSFLSGRRPDTTKVYTFRNSFRDIGAGPNWTSLLGMFKANGYLVAGQGKVYHPHSPLDDDGNKSWSADFLPYPEWSQRGDPCPGGAEWDPFTEQQLPLNASNPSARRKLDEDIPSDPANGPACPMPQDANITDALIADLALYNLGILAKAPNPFVLAVGFHKPHLPWAVPAAYYDMSPAAVNVPLAAHPLPPTGMPELAFWSCSMSELSGYSNGAFQSSVVVWFECVDTDTLFSLLFSEHHHYRSTRRYACSTMAARVLRISTVHR